MTVEFTAWPKMSRLYRDIVITEKIDGTNAAIGVQEHPFGYSMGIDPAERPQVTVVVYTDDEDLDGIPIHEYWVYAQSRTRLITPESDNFGFAAWVWENAYSLSRHLGPGLHFGEWWGSGIQRGYGLPKGEKRFSLFNTSRWGALETQFQLGAVPGLRVVPTLYQGMFDGGWVQRAKETLTSCGSYAAPGFMNPEGVVIFHTASNTMFKSTLDKDELPKGQR